MRYLAEVIIGEGKIGIIQIEAVSEWAAQNHCACHGYTYCGRIGAVYDAEALTITEFSELCTVLNQAQEMTKH